MKSKKKMVFVRFLLNRWMNFNQTCIDTFWEEKKSLLAFGDLNLIFKVTGAL